MRLKENVPNITIEFYYFFIYTYGIFFFKFFNAYILKIINAIRDILKYFYRYNNSIAEIIVSIDYNKFLKYFRW